LSRDLSMKIGDGWVAIVLALGIVGLGCGKKDATADSGAGIGDGGDGGDSDPGVGRPCNLQLSVDAGPSVTVIFPRALECPSGICVKPKQEIVTDTGPFCTVTCERNEDCGVGELRSTNPSDRRCQTEFVCRAVLPAIEGDPLGCRRMCLCKDFLHPSVTDQSLCPDAGVP
jgi:hypothetical protein